MKGLLTTAAALALLTTAANADALQVQANDGFMNVRSGPGVNYSLLGTVPNGTRYEWPGRPTCVRRQDGIAGAPWCKVNYNGQGGWISMAGLMPTTTTSPTYNEVQSGAWTAYKGLSNTGTPTCGIRASGHGMDIHLKYQPDADGDIAVQMFKNTWSFASDIEVPLSVGFDKNVMLTATAHTKSGDSAGSFVEFGISGDRVADFLHEFGEADRMWIRFETGNEEPWEANMAGSRNAAAMFAGCIASLPKATVPFGPQATVPFGDQKATAKKDNGSI